MKHTSNHKCFEQFADEEGWFPPDEGGACPVPDTEIMNNIRINIGRNLPNLRRIHPHDKKMIMVCGGSTAKNYLDDIKAKMASDNYDVYCSNKTHDWLISNGIIPTVHFMIDPKPSKVDDVKNPHKDVKYVIGVQCNPAVFDALEGYDVTRSYCFSNIGGDNRDLKLCRYFIPKEEIEPLFGGTMAGLRSMVLAEILGYRTVEFYGFDSCFFDYDGEKPIYYSYKKERTEDILEAKTDSGKIYLTTPVFASQARQFIKWKYRLPWMKFIIHGDSLTRQLDIEDEERNKRTTDKLITDEYRELLRKMHNDETFGDGIRFHALIADYLKDITFLLSQVNNHLKNITVLDYGCGKGNLRSKLPNLNGMTVKDYDPYKDENPPEIADAVLCLDVLEHVEPECLENVLDDLKRVINHIGYFSIALFPAVKNLPNGKNAHLIVQNEKWWLNKLRSRFKVLETEIKIHEESKEKFMTAIVMKGVT